MDRSPRLRRSGRIELAKWARTLASAIAEQVDEARRLEELEQIAEGLRAAVLRKDSDSLLNYYWRDAEKADPWSGVWAVANADGAGTYESERRALADRTSAPFCLLFDSTCRRAMAEPEHRDDPSFRISVRDFFPKGPVTTEIFFRSGPDVTQVDLDRAVRSHWIPGQHILNTPGF